MALDFKVHLGLRWAKAPGGYQKSPPVARFSGELEE